MIKLINKSKLPYNSKMMEINNVIVNPNNYDTIFVNGDSLCFRKTVSTYYGAYNKTDCHKFKEATEAIAAYKRILCRKDRPWPSSAPDEL